MQGRMRARALRLSLSASSRVTATKTLAQSLATRPTRSTTGFTESRLSQFFSPPPSARRAELKRFSSSQAASEPKTEPLSSQEDIKEPPPSESVSGQPETREFQAETRKILDIVSKAIYTDREVFIRELVSNASDALEKARFSAATGTEFESRDMPLEIRIDIDKKNNTITFQDTGIGMTQEELSDHLGTIGRSGSKAFAESMKASHASHHKEGDPPTQDEGLQASTIIGQFGVGFYSAFMVSPKVEVYSKSGKPGSKAFFWRSDGSGKYDMAEANNVQRGTKIIVHLAEDAQKQFTDSATVERVIKRYSNFVGFPIFLNGKRINTLGAIWTMDKDSITDEQHNEFFRFISGSYEDPQMRLHYSTDSPLSLRALLYVPKSHTERFGGGRMEPGVSLYSRKVLIENRSVHIVPDWLRFLRGVVDSEDLPLHVSREKMQNSKLMRQLNQAITRRVLRWFEEQAKKDPKAYLEFYNDFSHFLKEGVVSDRANQAQIAKILMFNSTADAKNMTTLDDYVSRMPASQKNIYFLTAPNRAIAEDSPYLEVFKTRGVEVLFLFEQIDEFALANLGRYGGRTIRSIESANLDDIPDLSESKDDAKKPQELSENDQNRLQAWLVKALPTRLSNVRISKRLVNSPAIVVDHESAAVRQMLKMVDESRVNELGKQTLEINPKHPVIVGLAGVYEKDEKLAKMVAEQLVDNALIAAGLLDDPRSVLPRLNQILEKTLGQAGNKVEAGKDASGVELFEEG